MLRQFEYSFGKDKVDELLRTYQQRWRFRHPYPPDFEKIGTEVFGQRMDEVFDTFLRGTELPDYTLQSLRSEPTVGSKFKNTLQIAKRERAHVPLRLFATDVSGAVQALSIPSDMLNAPNKDTSRLTPWFWVAPDYTAEFITERPLREVRLDTAGNLLRHDLTKNTIQASGLFPALPEVKVGFMTRFDEAAPLDYYGVSVRPSVWYDPLGGLQLGVRADGVGTYQTPKITAGAYYNLGNKRFDWQLGLQQTVGSGGIINILDAKAFSMDGVSGLSLRAFNDIRPVRYARESFSLSSIMIDFLSFDDAHYLLSKIFQNTGTIMRLGAMGEQRWRTGYVQLEANVSSDNFIATTTFIGGQLRFEWMETLFDSPYFSLKPRAFVYLATIGTPQLLQYSLRNGTALERFENIPSRYMRFSAYNLHLPVFTPGGGGLVSYGDEVTGVIAALNLFLGNKTLKSMGVSVPIVGALKPGAWISGALAPIRNITGSLDYFSFDSGISLSINLADIAPESRLLWMFKDEVSLTAYVPLVSYIPGRAWIVGYDGVRLGVSTTIPR
jgi:hypothetical protein